MGSVERKLPFALRCLLPNLTPGEYTALDEFVDNLSLKGKIQWLRWSKEAIERRRQKKALADSLYKKFGGDHPLPAIMTLLNQFDPELITALLNESDEPLESPSQTLRSQIEDASFRKHQDMKWVMQNILPHLFQFEGARQMESNIKNATGMDRNIYEQIHVFGGEMYIQAHDHHGFEPLNKGVNFSTNIDPATIQSGIVWFDRNTQRQKIHETCVFNLNPDQYQGSPSPVPLSLRTAQNTRCSAQQWLDLVFYDSNGTPSTSDQCHLVQGTFTSYKDGEEIQDEFISLQKGSDGFYPISATI